MIAAEDAEAMKRGECPACHNRSIPIESGVMAPHVNPNPFLSVSCLGTGRPPVQGEK